MSRHRETDKLAILFQLMSRKEARKKRKALTRERTRDDGGAEEALAGWNQIAPSRDLVTLGKRAVP